MTLKIGIPRTLLFFYYYPFCKTFFEYLELEVVLSDKTNKKIVNDGLNKSVNDLCLPIKVLYGHIENLKEKKVDYILMPYILTTDGKSYLCPKLIGSPDIIKATFDDISLITPDIDMGNPYSSLYYSSKELIKILGLKSIKLYHAYKEAIKTQTKFDKLIAKGYLFEEAIKILFFNKKIKQTKHKKTIAIVAHPYILHDEFINGKIIEELKNNKINIVNSDMLREEDIEKNLKIIPKIPHWKLGNRVLGSSIYFSKKKNIDGIIYLMPFGCSSDSIIKEYMQNLIKKNKPFMTITLDEHSGHSGVITRIEAFLDIIKNENSMLSNWE
ncbi:MAG: acyl-CoA dehydratase activase-related protein [Nanoarchaeota archaeon]